MRPDRCWVALLLVGCHPGDAATGDTAPSTPTCGAEVVLGTGTDAFVEVADGDPLPLVFGPQGGYHLPLALRGCGVGAPLRSHVVGVLQGSGEVVADVTVSHVWRPVDACCGVLLDLKGYVAAGVDPLSLVGDTVVLDYDGVLEGSTPGEPLVDHLEVVVGAP
ncbi:MAG: hypothetical protein R3F59_00755 [Myxococcota bacterium]